jgi:hypothetical protein
LLSVDAQFYEKALKEDFGGLSISGHVPDSYGRHAEGFVILNGYFLNTIVWLMGDDC